MYAASAAPLLLPHLQVVVLAAAIANGADGCWSCRVLSCIQLELVSLWMKCSHASDADEITAAEELSLHPKPSAPTTPALDSTQAHNLFKKSSSSLRIPRPSSICTACLRAAANALILGSLPTRGCGGSGRGGGASSVVGRLRRSALETHKPSPHDPRRAPGKVIPRPQQQRTSPPNPAWRNLVHDLPHTDPASANADSHLAVRHGQRCCRVPTCSKPFTSW
jgi:hypothetical protein